MKLNKMYKLAEWGYRLEAQMPDGFTALRSLAFIFVGMIFLIPGR